MARASDPEDATLQRIPRPSPLLIKVPRMRRTALAICLAVALTGCGSSGSTIPIESLNKVVLEPQDLGRQFQQFAGGRQGHLDNQPPRDDPTRYGREGGWIARFNRAGSAKTRGPLVVESRADLFKSSGDAKLDLRAYRELFASPALSQRRPVTVPKIGDEAVGQTFVQPGTKPLRFYRIAWRYLNATAAVTVEGFDGNVHAADAIALARKQQRRLQRS
jgi:hypothetical protein